MLLNLSLNYFSKDVFKQSYREKYISSSLNMLRGVTLLTILYLKKNVSTGTTRVYQKDLGPHL